MSKDKPILFFDGFCNLCDGLVNIVMKFNKGQFYVASIQGYAGKKNLTDQEIKSLNTLIFLDDGVKYYKSRAVFRLFWRVGGLCAILSLFKIIPISFTDFVYDWVARNRYQWFGKKEVCRLPTEKEKKLFLD